MDDTFSKGFPFELDDIWRKSTLQLDKGDEGLFLPPATTLPELTLSDANELNAQIFQIPALGDVNGIEEQALEPIESEVPSPYSAPTETDAADVWTLSLEHDDVEKLPRLVTWESFERKQVPNAERTAYLSEAGPIAFSSALHNADRKTTASVLPYDVLLRALGNLALGRSSIFFQWDSTKKTFFQTLEDTQIVGYSVQSYQDFINTMIEFGSALRNLAGVRTTSTSSRCSSTAIIAFKGCLGSILDGIEEHIATGLPDVRSMLLLQKLTKRCIRLVKILADLKGIVEGCGTDEEVMSRLSNQVHHLVETGICFSDLLRVTLTRVSAPWLERLCEDLGINNSQFGRQHPRSSQNDEEPTTDNLDASFDRRNQHGESLPSFVSKEDRSLIIETKASFQLLRRHLPDYNMASSDTINARVTFSSRESFPNSILGAAESNDAALYNEVHSQSNLARAAEPTESLAWGDDEQRLDYFRALDSLMSRFSGNAYGHDDELHLSVKRALQGKDLQPTGLREDLDYSPLERLRPIIQEHKRSMDRALLRHLFFQCRLRHHLDIQRQYHLFGNGDFVARLTTALFSDETQTAERRRGTVPTGETMGLRLGAREGQRWPPASSELRLTLMGVLNETYHPEDRHRTHKRPIKELPGGLSFSVRELPDTEIERVLDAESIYALDFLRLQYTAPPSLEAILTRSSMQAYDSIFRFLLRLLRVLHVTTKLHEQAKSSYSTRSQEMLQNGNPSTAKASFAIEAHQFTSVLISHFMDVGIAAQWQSFTATLLAVENALSDDTNRHRGTDNHLIGLDGLRQLHETCLERMRNRLFLRRKQEKLRTAVEDVCTAVLRCASAFEKGESDGGEVDSRDFRAARSALCALLRNTVDKPLKGSSGETEESDVDAMRILLGRLR